MFESKMESDSQIRSKHDTWLVKKAVNIWESVGTDNLPSVFVITKGSVSSQFIKDIVNLRQ
jgi:hypothetical protein